MLKIDVEGFEGDVIAGARDTLGTCKPRLWLELHPAALASRGERWEDLIGSLEALGYEVSRFADFNLPARDLGFHAWCEATPK